MVYRITGVYVICDGGYHAWPCCMNPYVHVSERRQHLWSEWIESCRKDVECVFGSMKKRFRFLKHAIEIHSQHHIDNAFFTCCILHNMILMYDGLDSRWEENIDWDALDPFDDETGNPDVVNRAALLLSRVSDSNSYLHSNRVIPGNETQREEELSHEIRRGALVTNFEQRFLKQSVSWPKGFSDKQRRANRLL